MGGKKWTFISSFMFHSFTQCAPMSCVCSAGTGEGQTDERTLTECPRRAGLSGAGASAEPSGLGCQLLGGRTAGTPEAEVGSQPALGQPAVILSKALNLTLPQFPHL